MKIEAFPIKKSVQEARAEATKKGFLARLLGGGKEGVDMRTIYIENRIITFEVTRRPALLPRMFGVKDEPRKAKIEMIANGSTRGVSYYDRRGLVTEALEVDDGAVQMSDYPDEDLILRANALARRILRRRVGGNMNLEPLEIKSVFRPYHVAFFGEPKEGSRVWYVPIAADDCVIKRTF